MSEKCSGFGPRNAYFAFVKPADIYVLAAHIESNTWVGASRALDPVYRKVHVKPGDQIHALVGGNFLVRRDRVAYENPSIDEPFVRHLFLKNYGISTPRPLNEQHPELLAPIDKAAAFCPKGYRNPLPMLVNPPPGAIRQSHSRASENVARVVERETPEMKLFPYMPLPAFEVPEIIRTMVSENRFEFSFDGICISEPWLAEDGFGEVDPVVHYGDKFIAAVEAALENNKQTMRPPRG